MTIDMKLLKKQRKNLVTILDSTDLFPKEREALDGILNLLDLISDSINSAIFSSHIGILPISLPEYLK